MTVLQAVQSAAAQITRRDAEYLLLHVLGWNRASLLAHPDAELSPDSASQFAALVQRRASHEPLQYLTGEQEFYGLRLRVSSDVLIPRPETELLVEAVLRWSAGRPFQVVDVGTGSGAIALALAAHLPAGSHVTALDLSAPALAIAEANAERLQLRDKVSFELSDLLAAVASLRFDAVVSNPPYIPQGDMQHLEPQVRDFEPHSALFAGPDGLDTYRRLLPQAAQALLPGGLLALEFGFGQQPAMAGLLAGWRNVNFLEDLAGIPRVATAIAP